MCINCHSLPEADNTGMTQILNFHVNENKIKYVNRLKKNPDYARS